MLKIIMAVKKVLLTNASKYNNTLIRSTIDGMILDIPQKVGTLSFRVIILTIAQLLPKLPT